jgi:hypothetical protein
MTSVGRTQQLITVIRRERAQVALWISLTQLVPLLLATTAENLLFRESRLAEATGRPTDVAAQSEMALMLLAAASIVGGPFAGLTLAKRRVPNAAGLPFLALLPVCAGWAFAWSFIPLWPGWAARLLWAWGVPLEDHAVWLGIANWLYFIPVMFAFAFWGTGFRGGSPRRDITLVLLGVGASLLFVRVMSPHAFL